MQLGLAAGGKDQLLLLRGEAWHFYGDLVFADWDGVEVEFTSVVAGGGLTPVGVLGAQRDLGSLDGTVLRIVDESAN